MNRGDTLKRAQAQSTRKRLAGFTLMEIMVATVVLLIALAATLRALRVGTDTYQAGMASGALHEECRRLVERVVMDVLPARVLFVETNPLLMPQINCQVPVDIGEDANGDGLLNPGEDANGNGMLDLTDGDVVDAAGSIEWGAAEAAAPVLGNSITFIFVQTATLTETAAQFDINADGDLADTFRLGNVQMRTTGGRLATYGQGSVLLDIAASDADLNGDGILDPMFSTTLDTNGNAATVSINLWMLTTDSKGRYIKVNEKTAIRLPNDQT